jgi:hypothetical protein
MSTEDRGDRADRTDRWIRVWWDTTVLCHYRAEPAIATKYVEAVRPHFAGLRFTIDPLPADFPPARELPARQLWELAP